MSTTTAPGEGAAEAWLARLMSPDCSSAERAQFEDWLAQSPEHVEAYLQVERVHALAAALARDDLLRAATRKAQRAPAASRRWVWGSAAAAVVVMAMSVLLWWPQGTAVHSQVYATATGELREVALDDGTLLRLDTGTRLTARFDDRQRVIELHRGRAQFVVGRDPQRPFRVEAGAGTVRDIGTTFQVRREGDTVDVGLLEGRVEVSVGSGSSQRSASLAPGEQVRFDGGTLRPTQSLDLAAAQAWPQGDLVFTQRRLDQLLAESNRYSRQQVRLADPALGALTVSGVFHAGDQQALVAALERGWALRPVRSTEDEIVLAAAR